MAIGKEIKSVRGFHCVAPEDLRLCAAAYNSGVLVGKEAGGR